MLVNDNARWNIWEQTGFTCDYNIFVDRCVSSGTAPMDIFEFSTKVGMLLVARATFALEDDKSNYVSIVNNNSLLWDNTKAIMIANGINPDEATCGGCGGGTVI